MITPRWLGLLALAVALAVGAVLLGRWQWSVAHDRARAEAVQEIQSRPVQPIAEVLAPHQSFPDDGSGQRVTVAGEYAAGDGFVVVDRLLDGRTGMWLVERLVVAETGANLAVVRGWLPAGSETPPAPKGEVRLVVSLAPGESPGQADLPKGEASSIHLGTLVNEWPGDLYTGFGFVMEETRGVGDAGEPVTASGGLERVPPPLPDTSLDWRNASYAAQWFAIAAFVIWMWWRMMRQESRAVTEDESEEKEAAHS